MRIVKMLIGVVALSGPVLAVAHDPEHGHDHEGCCCRHDEHHGGHHREKTGPRSDQKTTPEKPRTEQLPSNAPAEKPAPANPK